MNQHISHVTYYMYNVPCCSNATRTVFQFYQSFFIGVLKAIHQIRNLTHFQTMNIRTNYYQLQLLTTELTEKAAVENIADRFLRVQNIIFL